jgi:hypothetical protein
MYLVHSTHRNSCVAHYKYLSFKFPNPDILQYSTLSQISDYMHVCVLRLQVAMPVLCSPSDPLELCDGRLEVPHSDGLLFPSRVFQLQSTPGLSFSKPQASRLSHFINWFSATARLIPPSQNSVQGSCRDAFTQHPVQTAAWRAHATVPHNSCHVSGKYQISGW